jgi:hypothetical protein
LRFRLVPRWSRYLGAQRRRGTLLHFAITGLDDGDYLGEILLFLCAAQAAELGVGEIAYVTALTMRPWNRAGSRRSSVEVGILGAWAGASPALDRAGNTSSARVAERAGYRDEDLLRSLKVIRGRAGRLAALFAPP